MLEFHLWGVSWLPTPCKRSIKHPVPSGCWAAHLNTSILWEMRHREMASKDWGVRQLTEMAMSYLRCCTQCTRVNGMTYSLHCWTPSASVSSWGQLLPKKHGMAWLISTEVSVSRTTMDLSRVILSIKSSKPTNKKWRPKSNLLVRICLVYLSNIWQTLPKYLTIPMHVQSLY